MGGYRVGSTRELTVNTAATVTALGPTVENVAPDLAAEIGTLPAPAAGTSIAPALSTVQAAWNEAIPKVGMELRLIGGSVKASATMIEAVEIDVRGPFARFAE